ncbi:MULTISPECIES: hypothetical protein [unclassified Bacillus (in: firmicutes)]|uniref:hypothetical protein n=1 Tax=unclassified Bacillus (in: firmicutes) TaxID=185979 RepID=UPI000C78F6D1|nr:MULTISPECIES: hypothetical protein [unclassified Bacillus (in: firmicutes)]MDT0160454.1 hypothetical protein [Bacillus sp. AG4(2022)]PLR72179.1 hypothetical protein CYJ37_11525 [Bacillus sp. UMB0728]
MNNNNILIRIDEALERMRNDGAEDDNCPYYERLKAKRNAIANGASYATYSIAPYLIAYVGSHIPDVNIGMDNKVIKGRGDKRKATLKAITGVE